MPHPARERVLHCVLMTLGQIQEGGRTRSAIEKLVAAANRHIDIAGIQCNRHRTGAVCQVPQYQCTCIVRGLRKRTHIVLLPGAEVHLGQHQHSHV